jgi:DNA-binding MarR family transcriptional regulator
MQDNSIGKYITIIYENMNYYINRKLEKYNIKRSQLQILHYLYLNGGICQNEIGKALMLDKVTVTKVLTVLVNEDLVEKREVSEDKRRKELYVTEKGNRLQGEIFSIMEEVADAMFEGFSEGERQLYKELSIRVSRNIYTATISFRQ